MLNDNQINLFNNHNQCAEYVSSNIKYNKQN